MAQYYQHIPFEDTALPIRINPDCILQHQPGEENSPTSGMSRSNFSIFAGAVPGSSAVTGTLLPRREN